MGSYFSTDANDIANANIAAIQKQQAQKKQAEADALARQNSANEAARTAAAAGYDAQAKSLASLRTQSLDPAHLQNETLQTGALPEYATIRDVASQKANAQKQANIEALQRRFAAQGTLNSGAAIKAQSQTAQASDQGAQEQMASIGLDEAKSRQAQNEGIQTRNLQRDSQRFDEGLKLSGMGMDLVNAMRQGNLQERAQALAESEDAFNRRLEQYKAGHSGGLLGGGGFLGTGLGATTEDLGA